MSLRHRLFRALGRFDVRYPWLVLTAAAVISVASALYTGARLQFHTGQSDLISTSNRANRNYLRYTSEFPDIDGLIVMVDAAKSPVRAEEFADALAARLREDRTNVKSVFYRIDPATLADGALLYLSRTDLKKLVRRIRRHREFLRRYAAHPSLDTFFRQVNDEANRAMMAHMVAGFLETSDGDARSEDLASALNGRAASTLDVDLLDSVLEGMLADGGKQSLLPWNRMAGMDAQAGAIHDGYLATANGKYVLLNVAPADGASGGPDPVDAIQHHLDRVRAQFPDVDAGMTGGPALARAEETSTTHDIALASAIAVTANVLLIVIPFGSLVEPLFALAALLVGVTWSFGFTTLALGHLNLLSAVFTSVLAGIGINFSIHLMARYDEARRAGHPMLRALEIGVVNTGEGVVASATIMAVAFLMPVFTDFRGIAELGLVSAAGLFLCLVSAMLVFPALVALRDRNRPAATLTAPPGRRHGALAALLRRPSLVLGATSVVTLGAIVLGLRVNFDLNLLKLQADDTEAVIYETKLLKDGGRSSWFAVSLAPDRAEAERRAKAFRRLPEVSSSETIATYIPQHQTDKRAMIERLRPALRRISLSPVPLPGDSAALLSNIDSLNFKLTAAQGGDPSGKIAHTAALLGRAATKLKRNPQAFRDYEFRMAEGFGELLKTLKSSLSPPEIKEASLPSLLRSRFVGASGSYLVQIYPKGDVWGDAPLERFVNALRTVDPDVTGPPVQTYSVARVMRSGYERAALLALLAVFIFVFADFRRLRDTALATVPLLFGGAWLLGTMGLLGWKFNLASLFAVPIIIGTAVDNGVNMVYRWREEGSRSQSILDKAVGKSVIICSLTTIAGFAALIPASHRGISSLGWVLSTGVAFTLTATVIVLPALFALVGGQTKHAGKG